MIRDEDDEEPINVSVVAANLVEAQCEVERLRTENLRQQKKISRLESKNKQLSRKNTELIAELLKVLRDLP